MHKKTPFIAVIILIIALLVIFKLMPYLNRPEENVLTVSGRVEADEISLSSMIPGRLRYVYIKDGMEVKKGDPAALIEDEELQSRRAETTRKAEEFQEKIRSMEIEIDYSNRNIDHTIEEAHKAVSIAKARGRQAEAKREKTGKDYRRYEALLQKGAIPQERFDSAGLAHTLAEEEYNTAIKEVERAGIALRKAEDSRELLKARHKELDALRKALKRIEEELKQIDINIGYTRITAPSDGIILRRLAEPGEVIGAGGLAGVMINPESLHVKTFVPEPYIGRINLKMPADIISDAYPERPFKGYICHISDRAEFTPKEVQSYEERIKEVFAVKVCLPDYEEPGDKSAYRVLKKGMPVDVKFHFTQLSADYTDSKNIFNMRKSAKSVDIFYSV